MNVYLDDERVTPAGWQRVYTIEEVITLLQNNLIDKLSLDHDLGEDEHGQLRKNGYDLLKYMAEFELWPKSKIFIHSANPVGRMNMQSIIDRYAPIHCK